MMAQWCLLTPWMAASWCLARRTWLWGLSNPAHCLTDASAQGDLARHLYFADWAAVLTPWTASLWRLRDMDLAGLSNPADCVTAPSEHPHFGRAFPDGNTLEPHADDTAKCPYPVTAALAQLTSEDLGGYLYLEDGGAAELRAGNPALCLCLG